jgi:hypothetical protein
LANGLPLTVGEHRRHPSGLGERERTLLRFETIYPLEPLMQ